MFNWRITKYDPQYRNEQGHYLKDEWTFFAQVGTVIEGKTLTFDEYIEMENKYIQAVISFMECLEIDSLQIINLKKNKWASKESLNTQDIQTLNNLINKQWVNIDLIRNVMRLILREIIVCRLTSKQMSVHFGYDYYMFVETATSCSLAIKKIEKSGLFVEEYISPYKQYNL